MEGDAWLLKMLRERPELLQRLLTVSVEELAEERRRDFEECSRMGVEGVAEYASRTARRLEPLLLFVASRLPPEEREMYLRQLEALKRKEFPTFNYHLYSAVFTHLLRKANEIISRKL